MHYASDTISWVALALENNLVSEGTIHPSLDHNKMERRQMDPIGSAFAAPFGGLFIKDRLKTIISHILRVDHPQ